MIYFNKWKANNLNKEFWSEVFLGQTIVQLGFDEIGPAVLKLSSGEDIFLPKTGPRIQVSGPKEDEHGRIMISDEEISRSPEGNPVVTLTLSSNAAGFPKPVKATIPLHDEDPATKYVEGTFIRVVVSDGPMKGKVGALEYKFLAPKPDKPAEPVLLKADNISNPPGKLTKPKKGKV